MRRKPSLLEQLRRHPVIASGMLACAVWGVWIAIAGGISPATTAVVEGWPITLTMVFGSVVAGVSSEGGGAVAFPVFTKVLAIPPADAKLFALAIQSVGMTAASALILLMRVRVDWRAIIWASLGGVAGMAIGLLLMAPLAPPAHVRVFFTAMQASFALVLWMSLRRAQQPGQTPGQGARLRGVPGAVLLLLAGLLGGIASGLVGSGLDLYTFSMLVLLFRVSEKVATPTSVVLMAGNSLAAMAMVGLQSGGLPESVQSMWLAAAPVVVIGAPLGAWICSRLRRETIAYLLMTLIAVEVATSAWVLPKEMSVLTVGLLSAFIFSSLYLSMYFCGLFDPARLRENRRERAPLAADPWTPYDPLVDPLIDRA